MNRRSFIQRFVYSILVLFFGFGILERLDYEETERVIDDLDARLPRRGIKLGPVRDRLFQSFRDPMPRDAILAALDAPRPRAAGRPGLAADYAEVMNAGCVGHSPLDS